MLGNWENKFYEDEYNVNGKRNRKNTNREDYNCGGYALQTFSWVLPCEDEDECSELYDLDIDWEEEEDNIDWKLRYNYLAAQIHMYSYQPDLAQKYAQKCVDICKETSCQIQVLPGLYSVNFVVF